MSYVYIATTDKNLLPGNPIVMVDGTVPGWEKGEQDLHFDHHRKGGEEIQLWEIPDNVALPKNAVFVTTQTDADACAAAAWLQLLQMRLDPAEQYEAYATLSAIAYDCDHLGLPADKKWDAYRDFAAKAVAALKEVAKSYVAELGMPSDRKLWTDAAKAAYASYAFQKGTEWLVDACLGKRKFPGEQGEADSYFAEMESQRQRVAENCRLYKAAAIFDQRSFDGYVDPRLLVEWARENNSSNVTLTVRSGARQPNAAKLIDAGHPETELFSYTLGSVPLHRKGSPNFSDHDVWEVLANLENEVRAQKGLEPPDTQWGGRDAVGGSSWRDPAIASPEEVIDRVLRQLEPVEDNPQFDQSGNLN